MTDEQLTLNLPDSGSHGVVVEHGNRIERFQVGSPDGAVRLAEKVRQARTGTVWDSTPKSSGWYGIAPGGIVCRIAAY